MTEFCSIGDLAATVSQQADDYRTISAHLQHVAGDDGELNDALRYTKGAQDQWSEAEHCEVEADKLQESNPREADRQRAMAEVSSQYGRGMLGEAVGTTERSVGTLGSVRDMAEQARGRVIHALRTTNMFLAEDAMSMSSVLPDKINEIISPAQAACDGLKVAIRAHQLYEPMGLLDEAMFRLNQHGGALVVAQTIIYDLSEYAGYLVGGGGWAGYSFYPPAVDTPPSATGPIKDPVEQIEQVIDDIEVHIRDYKLLNDLIETVDDIPLEEVIQPNKRHKLPADLTPYGLVTISGPYTGKPSLTPANRNGHLPMDAVSNHKYEGGMPWLDASQAIALTVRNTDGENEVRGVAAAGIDHGDRPGTLLINQLQAIGIVHTDEGRQSMNGALRSFNWRKTLVTAWEKTAVRMGITEIGIQGARNNKWPAVNGKAVDDDEKDMYDEKYHYDREPATAGYDKVAESLGYTFDPKTGNWYKKLSGSKQ